MAKLHEQFQWAPLLVKEILPGSEPAMESFDWGYGILIGWTLPSGKKKALHLHEVSAIGGEYVDGDWKVEPEAWMIHEITKTGLRKAVLKSLEADKV